jgi:phosphohistidine phosphatase SixA
MKLILVRHSKPVENMPVGGEIGRPLSKIGFFRAHQFGRKLLKRYGHDMDLILSSHYVMSVHTADIIAGYLKPRKRMASHLLNPGTPADLANSFIRESIRGRNSVMVIGHYPELSELTATITGNLNDRIYFNKPSCLELEIDSKGINKVFVLSHDDENNLVQSPFKKKEADSEPIEEFEVG